MNLVNEGVLPPNELDDRDERREEREMAQERETLADIVAEMRELSRSGELATGASYCEPQPTVHGKPIGIYFSEIADRIEAIDSADAWRSLYTPVGNAAAMREAMVEALNKVNDAYDMLSKPCVTLEEVRQACREARGIIIPALSEPARNCDKMPDIDKLTMHDLAKSPCKSTLECASREELLALVRWLLAPAAERKGEGDGR